MKKIVKKFEKQRLLSLILAVLLIVGIFPNFARAEEGPEVVDLDPADVEIFPAKNYEPSYDRDFFKDDEIGIVVKREARTKYDGKRIRIPDTINGKTVVALGHPKANLTAGNLSSDRDLTGFINHFYYYDSNSENGTIRPYYSDDKIVSIYFPDLSQATHIKYIADSAFFNSLKDETLELKDLPALRFIGYLAFGRTKLKEIKLENLPSLEVLSVGAFEHTSATKVSIDNLPVLKTMVAWVFEYSDLKTVDIKGVPKLEVVGNSVFTCKNLEGNIDLRSATNLIKLDKGNGSNNAQVLISEPGPNFTGNYILYRSYDNGNKQWNVGLHRLTFEFAPKDGIGVIPDALKEKQPKSYCVYPALDKLGDNFTFDPNNAEPFTKFTDTVSGDEWEFKGWNTEDEFQKIDTQASTGSMVWEKNKTIHNVKYTGTWELLFSKKGLKDAIAEANAKKKDVVVSADGEGLPFTTKWVTDSAQNEFTTAINTAQGIFDSDTVPGNTKEERQQYIDNATKALKEAIAKYNPQEGKQTYDKNPTYAQPAGAHKVTFVKGAGIESLTDESTFYYVKDNTVLPADKFPQATAQAGFGTKIFWNPAQDTPITSDQAFTASARAVDKAALQAKIQESEELLNKDSTSDPAVALKTVVDEAKALIAAVDAGTERNQDTVDAKVTELENAIQALKDLNAKKDAAKTEIGAIDGLSNEEKDKLKEEVDKAKNEDAINEIKDKATEQAKDNNALKEATTLVEKAEQEKTQEAYDAAKAKVDALKDGADKTALEGRLSEVDKYIKADDALKVLEGKDIKDVTDTDLTNVENLINQVKDDWKAPLTQRLEALKTAKTEYDTEKAAEDEAEKAVKDLEDKKGNVTDEEIADAQEKVDKVTDPTKKDELQERLDKVKEDKKKVDDEKAAEDEAEKAVKDLEDKNGNVTDDEIADAQDKVDKVTDPDKKKDLQDRLDKVKEDKKKVDDEKKAEDEAEKAVKDLEDKKGNVTDEEIADVQDKVDKVTDPDKKKDLQDRLDKVKEDKKKVDDEKAAEDEAEKAVKDLEDKNGNVTDDEIADAQDKVDKVTDPDKKKDLQDRLDKVKEDKKKADDEKAAEDEAEKAVKDLEDKNGNVTDDEIADAQDKVDKVTDPDKKKDLQDRLDKVKEDKKKVDDEKAEADALAKAKEEARNTISALQNLTDDEKAPFIKRVDDATTIPEVNEAVLDAQKADAKKKVDAMDNLSKDEKDKAKEDIDNAQTKDEVDQVVEDAQNKNDQAEADALAKAKEEARNTINALQNLTDDEKAPFIKRVDDATTIPEVNEAVLDAQKADAKKKVDAMDNLTDDEKDKAKEDIDNAQTKDEVDQVVEDANQKDEDNKNRSLEEAKQQAKEEINKLNNLDQTEKDGFNQRIDQANTKEDVAQILDEAKKLDNERKTEQEKLQDKKNELLEKLETKVNGKDVFSPEEKQDLQGKINSATTLDELRPIEEEINNKIEAARRAIPTPQQDPLENFRLYWVLPLAQAKQETQQKKLVTIETIVKIGSKKLTQKINGVANEIEMDVEAYIAESRTYIPLRFVGEALGYEVTWDEANRTAILRNKDKEVKVAVDSNVFYVNGEKFESDVKPMIKNGRTMIPVGNFARAIGLQDGKEIFWNEVLREVTIKQVFEY